MSAEILIVGSGFGAQSVAIRLLERGVTNFKILERREKMGGTWVNQAYPGAAVDIHSPLYSLSSEPYDWSEMFAPQSELEDYTNHILDKHGLRDKAVLGCTVTGAKWDGEARIWEVHTKEHGTMRARFLINASGQFAQAVIPKFPGIDTFEGASFHSSYWDNELDLTGKSVAVIGSGSSAAQIIPAIAEHVGALHVFQRTPHWVLPRPDHIFTPWERKMLRKSWIYNSLRQVIRFSLEARMISFKYSKFLRNMFGRKAALRHLNKQIQNPDLRARLTPDYEVGCKRVILSSTLYPALERENVQLHTGEGEGIAQITANGITRTDGIEVPVDVIAFATGYDTNMGYISYPVEGEGTTVKEHWAEHPSAYVGCAMHGFPNFFLMNGPYTAMAHSSALLMLEAQAEYIIKSIQAAGKEGAVEVTKEAEEGYGAEMDKAAKGTIWENGGCGSWYLTPKGRLAGLYPGFAASFQWRARQFRPRDHNIT